MLPKKLITTRYLCFLDKHFSLITFIPLKESNLGARHLSLAFIALMSLSGCGTLHSGTTDKYYFSAEPENVKVSVGEQSCRVPCALNISKTEKEVVFWKQGLSEKVYELPKRYNSVATLNLIGLIGFGVDAYTGALWEPDTVFIHGDLK